MRLIQLSFLRNELESLLHGVLRLYGVDPRLRGCGIELGLHIRVRSVPRRINVKLKGVRPVNLRVLWLDD